MLLSDQNDLAYKTTASIYHHSTHSLTHTHTHTHTHSLITLASSKLMPLFLAIASICALITAEVDKEILYPI